jgi:aryl-alcohol dehydrogenase-like predicted oxidoreductase
MKIALGTANFNNSYGILKNQISNYHKIKNIPKILKNNRIDYLDTAFDYGDFIINKNKKIRNIKVITKIKLPTKKELVFIDNLEEVIKKKLLKLNINSFDTILFHDINDLKSVYADRFIKKIKSLKRLNYFKKIGASIYDPKDLNIVFTKFTPDVIQLPINIFDNRILSSPWLKKLKRKKIIIQARSVFLQGILTSKISKLEKILKNKYFLSKVKKLDTWCKLNKISRQEACLNFIKSINVVDILVIGINNSKQLIEILNFLKKKNNIIFKDFSTNKLEVIDPRKWSKKKLAKI